MDQEFGKPLEEFQSSLEERKGQTSKKGMPLEKSQTEIKKKKKRRLMNYIAAIVGATALLSATGNLNLFSEPVPVTLVQTQKIYLDITFERLDENENYGGRFENYLSIYSYGYQYDDAMDNLEDPRRHIIPFHFGVADQDGVSWDYYPAETQNFEGEFADELSEAVGEEFVRDALRQLTKETRGEWVGHYEKLANPRVFENTYVELVLNGRSYCFRIMDKEYWSSGGRTTYGDTDVYGGIILELALEPVESIPAGVKVYDLYADVPILREKQAEQDTLSHTESEDMQELEDRQESVETEITQEDETNEEEELERQFDIWLNLATLYADGTDYSKLETPTYVVDMFFQPGYRLEGQNYSVAPKHDSLRLTDSNFLYQLNNTIVENHAIQSSFSNTTEKLWHDIGDDYLYQYYEIGYQKYEEGLRETMGVDYPDDFDTPYFQLDINGSVYNYEVCDGFVYPKEKLHLSTYSGFGAPEPIGLWVCFALNEIQDLPPGAKVYTFTADIPEIR